MTQPRPRQSGHHCHAVAGVCVERKTSHKLSFSLHMTAGMLVRAKVPWGTPPLGDSDKACGLSLVAWPRPCSSPVDHRIPADPQQVVPVSQLGQCVRTAYETDVISLSKGAFFPSLSPQDEERMRHKELVQIPSCL